MEINRAIAQTQAEAALSEAEHLLHVGDAHAAWSRVRSLLNMAEPGLAAQCHALLLAAHCASALGSPREAHDYAMRAMDLAEVRGDRATAARARLALGAALLDLGNGAAAVGHLELCVRAAEADRWGDGARAFVHRLLAEALGTSRGADCSLQHLQAAEALYAAAGDQPAVVDCLHRQAWALLAAGSTAAAGRCLQRSRTALGPGPDPAQLALEGWHLYALGRRDEARAQVRSVANPSGSVAPDWVYSCLLWVWASVEADLGEERLAGMIARTGLDFANRLTGMRRSQGLALYGALERRLFSE